MSRLHPDEEGFLRVLLRSTFAVPDPRTGGATVEGVGTVAVEFEERNSRLHDPAQIGAAVLFGRGVLDAPGLIRAIDEDASVVIMEVPSAEWVAPTAKAVRACFAIGHIVRPDADAVRMKDVDPEPRLPIVVAAGADGRSASRDADKVDRAFQEHRALIGVVAPSGRGLPEDLMRSCQERIVLKSLDAESLHLVVEHVVGERAKRDLTDALASAIGPGDLRIALHSARGADASVDRLASLVDGRSKASGTRRTPKLEDLAGYGRAREWGLTAAHDLACYGRGELEWPDCDPGVLLAGPPGTGKTMFAGAIARQAGVPIVSGSLARWQAVGEAHLGTTIKAMRAFFDEAGAASPCVALVDELDSFGDRSRCGDRNRDYQVQLVNAFLECLDGEGGRPGVLLVGTTNVPERIDPAIVRAGRFDRCMAITLPSATDLALILRHHLGDDLIGEDLANVARRASGGSGADCAALVRRARGRARRDARPLAIGDLVLEIRGVGAVRTAEQDRRIAVHESGHAIVAHLLGFEIGDIVLDHAVTGGAYVEYRSNAEFATADRLHEQLAAVLAGRAAEILVFGSATTGSGTDLVEATDLCRNMHCRWGLGRRISVCEPAWMPEDRKVALERDLRRAHVRAASLLALRRTELDRISEALLRDRSLDGRRIQSLLVAGGADAGER